MTAALPVAAAALFAGAATAAIATIAASIAPHRRRIALLLANSRDTRR